MLLPQVIEECTLYSRCGCNYLHLRSISRFISDKTIVQQSGLLNLLTVEDLVLADKGFLIQDLVPDGVSVNIPPFLINGWGIY